MGERSPILETGERGEGRKEECAEEEGGGERRRDILCVCLHLAPATT